MQNNDYDRRRFIQASFTFIALSPLAKINIAKSYKPLLSFSTLGCPDWTFEQIVSFAASNNYDGIEFRGIQRELDLTKCIAFNSDKNITSSLQLLKQHNLKISDLGSSVELHHAVGSERNKNIDDGKRFIDLAAKLHSPHIRVFPNEIPKNQDKQTTLDLIAEGLSTLGNYAKNTDVTVLLETHGEVVYTNDLVYIMQKANNRKTGLVWDIYNMWSVTKEEPAFVYEHLKNYIQHTHIKDARLVDGKEKYVLLGTGTSPIFQGVDLLAKNKFTGYYSFEWEKLWHPDIDAPEIAIADYPKKMKAHFKEKHLV